jgi:hypothetical protein
MFDYFKPQVIKEVYIAKSRISISFDGWGLKREKLSVISVVIYMVNNKNKNVTRLIGLLELLRYRKTDVDMCFISYLI